MKYKLSFIIIVFASSITGILIGLFTNNIIIQNDENKFNINENNVKKKDKNVNNDKEKNQVVNDNDYLQEGDDDKEKNEKNNNMEEENIKEEENKKIEEKEKEKDKNQNKEDENKKKENEDKTKEENKKIEEKEKDKNQNKEDENKKGNEEVKKNEEEKKNIKTHDVHLSLSIDAKYVYPCIVFLTSLLENRAPSTIYNVYILIGDSIKSEHMSKINTLINKYGQEFIKIKYFNMKNDFKGAITNAYISTASYYRIALPTLLPNVDRIIYSDTDVINFADLTEMYNIELKDNIYFRGTLDNVGLLNELRSFGIYETKYMNAGILLMNLKAIRKDNIETQLRNFIKTHYLDHHDQTAINAVCHNNVEILSFKYACFNYDKYQHIVDFNNSQDKRFRYSETELKQAFYEPTLLHFVGWTKPWDHGYQKSKGEYWWYYAKKSDFYKEILNNYRFSENDIDTLLKKIPEDGGLLKRNYKK